MSLMHLLQHKGLKSYIDGIENFILPGFDEYSALLTGQEFSDLKMVITNFKNPDITDVSRLHSRSGYSDFVQMKDAPTDGLPSWTVALVPSEGYLWFALKDISLLPSTMMWIANGGRKMYPWNGLNRCVGIEDVCASFAEGVGHSL
jgi:hypothetical protein